MIAGLHIYIILLLYKYNFECASITAFIIIVSGEFFRGVLLPNLSPV
jgi:hypothetical protein